MPFGSVGGTWTPLAGHFETMTYDGTAHTYSIIRKDQSKLTFQDASPGRLTKVEDRFGHALTLTWNSTTATITDASGRSTAIVIDGSGRITGATDSAGRAWAFAYDGSGDLVTLTDPESKATTFAYSSHRLTSISRTRTPQTGSAVTITWSATYDSLGRVVTLTDPMSATASLSHAFSYAHRQTTATLVVDTDGLTAKVRYTYDGSGRVTRLVTPDSLVTTTVVDGDGNVTSLTEPIDATTSRTSTFTYDARGNTLTEIRPITSSSTVPTVSTWNSTNDMLTKTEASGVSGVERVTEYTYTSGHLTQQKVDPQGTDAADANITTGYTYTANGQLETETDPLGRVTKHEYDSSGNETKVIRNDVTTPTHPDEDVTTTFAYANDTSGNAGLVTSETDPVGLVVTRVHDQLGRLTTETLPATGTSVGDTPKLIASHTYDELGNEKRTIQTERNLADSADGRVATTTTAFDVLDRTLTVTDPESAVTTTTYDVAGELIASVTAAGGASTSSTDPVTGVTTSVSSVGVTTLLQSNAVGGATSSRVAPDTASEIQTTSTYDLAGQLLTTVVDPGTGRLNLTTSHSYDKLGRELTATDPRGTTTTSTYDRVGRLTRTVVAGLTTDHTYDKTGNELSVTGPYASGETGIVQTTDYDGLDRAVKTVGNPVGGSSAADANIATETAYDASGRVVSERRYAGNDTSGTVIRSIYDTRGNLTKRIVDCTTSGTTIPTTGWDSCNGAGTNDGTFNLATTYAYDGRGNLISQAEPNGRVTTTTYDDAGRLETQTENDVASPSGNEDLVTTYYDDAEGREIAVKAPTADRTTFAVTRTFYDLAGRATKTIVNCTDSGSTVPTAPATCAGAGTKDAATNLTTTWSYDVSGNRIAETAADPSATTGTSTATITTRYAYDRGGRLCRVVENSTSNIQNLNNPCTSSISGGTATANVSTRYGYDANGDLTSMVDGRGDTTSYSYDTLRRMTGRTDPAGKVLSWAYDSHGNRVNQIDRIDAPIPQVSVSWTYDKADRMLTRVADGVTITFGYDKVGDRTTAQDPAGTITTAYDRIHRPTSVTAEDSSVTSYTYGHTTDTRTDASSGSAYSFTLDAFGRETALDDPVHSGSGNVTTSYRADGQRATRAQANGNTTTSGYDLTGHLTTMTTAAGGTNRAVYAYTYTRSAGRLSEASTITSDPGNGTTAFAYDKLGRLNGYTPAVGSAQTFGWQEVANRDSVTIGGSTTSQTFDASDRPTGTGFSHDLDGNMTGRPGQTILWDRLGRITSVKDASTSATISSYTYDALDRLRTVARSGSTIRFRYAGLSTSVTQIVDDGTSVSQLNVANDWSGERLFDWTGTNSNQRFYGTNGHGDVTWTADDTGAVISTRRYDPWGTVAQSWTASGKTHPDWRFQGSWRDSSADLYWVVARWYAAELGRFVSEDTLLGETTTPASRHLYAYAEGDPVGSWDPDGHYGLPWRVNALDSPAEQNRGPKATCPKTREACYSHRVLQRMYDCCGIVLTEATLWMFWTTENGKMSTYYGQISERHHVEGIGPNGAGGWKVDKYTIRDTCTCQSVTIVASVGFSYRGIFDGSGNDYYNTHSLRVTGNASGSWTHGQSIFSKKVALGWHWETWVDGTMTAQGTAT